MKVEDIRSLPQGLRPRFNGSVSSLVRCYHLHNNEGIYEALSPRLIHLLSFAGRHVGCVVVAHTPRTPPELMTIVCYILWCASPPFQVTRTLFLLSYDGC